MIWQYEEDRYFKKNKDCNNCDFNNYCRWLIWDYTDFYWVEELNKVTNADKKLLEILRKNKSNYKKWIEFNNSTT